MAGRHTKLSGVLYSSSLNVPNGASVISGNTQSIAYNGISRGTVNGSVATFHNTNGISAAHLFKPGSKIIVQGTSNGTAALVVGPLNNPRIPTVTKADNGVLSSQPLSNNTNFNNSFVKETKSLTPIPSHIEPSETYSQKEVKEEPEIISEESEEPVIDIMINNVVCSFSVGCHLDLRHIALTAKNVEFRRENGMVTMKLRRPLATASIWSSGKITCTGSTSENESRIAARRIARTLQKLEYTVRFRNYRVVNVLGTCTMPFAIKISQFSQKHRNAANYEPELHPGVTYKIIDPKATLKVFSTGSITVTAPSVENVQRAIEHIYPLVKEFGKVRSAQELADMRKKSHPTPPTQNEDSMEEDSDDEF